MGHVVVDQDPHVLVYNACVWIRSNPERWQQLLELCEWFHTQRPRERLRRGDLFNWAERKGLSITDCKAYKFNNNLWSVLSRYVLMCKPHLADNIVTRLCGVDTVDLRNSWETLIGDSSCLLADIRRPAA